ncbi:hypothetical protein RSSE_c3119 [Ralstonia solanacearum]|nr:hypothetical protein RSSE_c3119 [Ralstonia solanacearum]
MRAGTIGRPRKRLAIGETRAPHDSDAHPAGRTPPLFRLGCFAACANSLCSNASPMAARCTLASV